MNGYLLDTHSFLWSVDETEKLSQLAFEIILNPENTIHVSSITFWEISVKMALKKLSLKNYTSLELLKIAQDSMKFTLLPLSPMEAATFYQLPPTQHKDPFDRMLIWQAISQDCILISKDSQFAIYSEYGLKTLW
jgi:PIN domain nuclease of toxin-antitoxin system